MYVSSYGVAGMFRSLTKIVLQRRDQTLKLYTIGRCLKVQSRIVSPFPTAFQLEVPVKHFHNTSFSSSCDAVERDSSILGNVGVKMRILFTCKKCNTRNDKLMSKQAYENGIVLVRCDGCQNLHLIADNLNWFQNPHGKNIEDILASKGEKVQKNSNVYEFNSVDLEGKK